MEGLVAFADTAIISRDRYHHGKDLSVLRL